ncbi:hypothetical protein [Nonomuraea sp. NPDC049028]|uniref:hypothetical protein n=1 Tax=Nonomuraea sp. NPDC049028 TaxID=3364348 RepID=UPI003722B15B
MNSQSHQIFDGTFEGIWKDFDEAFRANLLKTIGQMGSLHRLSGDQEKINAEYGRRFYEALEETLVSGRFISKWKNSLVNPIPKSADELTEIFQLHSVYPSHAFYLLLVFIHEHPLRGFFSGRGAPIPFNTLTLKFEQLLSDPLPTGVNYELEMIQLDRCPGLAYDSEVSSTQELDASHTLPLRSPSRHPQHHWRDLIWVWHF